ncbi:MAG TPA: multidrug ABC transporter ATP-binding protein, partial [Burkholderiaceae bacterium]|nr:multidrug ABC transporter ATP-binding protein [Burkholderiaceae bacterium]
MFAWFERLVDPYPDALPGTPPRGLLRFAWAGTQGLRRYILAMTTLTAAIGAFEALLFAMLGRIVDWLGVTPPQRLWAEQGGTLAWLAALLLASPLAVAAQTMLKH